MSFVRPLIVIGVFLFSSSCLSARLGVGSRGCDLFCSGFIEQMRKAA